MDNPIPTTVRGGIYIACIILGALAGVVASVLAVLGLNAWQPVVAAAASAVALVTGILARANLTTEPLAGTLYADSDTDAA